MKSKSNKGRVGMIVVLLLLIGLGAGAGYIYTAPGFERVKPEIEGTNNIFWICYYSSFV